ncbi:MAG: carboxymuconolactone decarboxylase family protein [Planctomycetes bacterium]|nr:carboxymuconolactone decarboxylase family protein [Planctomycetota bacterium]
MAIPSFSVPVQSPKTAAAAAAPMLAAAEGKLGFVPNLFGVMANAPSLLEGYLALSSVFDKTSLSPTERQVVLLATSFENGCAYCMAAHTAIAGMQKVDAAVVEALRDGTPIAEPKLEALRGFTADVVRSRGWPSQAARERFLATGYTPVHALEVVLGVGMKTLSNYANHIVGTPLDAAFEAARWTTPASPASCCAQ